MARPALLAGLLCLLSLPAAHAQPFVARAIQDTTILRTGPGIRLSLLPVFGDSSGRPLSYEARTSDPAKIVAFTSDFNLFVFNTAATPKLGDFARVTVVARNTRGADSTAFMVTVDERPSIGTVVVNPREPQAGAGATLSVKITDNSGSVSAIALYRAAGGDTVAIAPMTLQEPAADSIYALAIDEAFITDRGLEYFIIAADSLCYPDFTPMTGQPAFVPVTSPGAVQPAPLPAGAYRLISVPLDLEGKSPATVFEDDLGDYDDTRWRFFEVEHEPGADVFSFVELPQLLDEDRNVQPGKAYLIIVDGEGRRIDSGPGTSPSTLAEFAVDLEPGWNFVGNPFNFSIAIESVRLQSSGQSPDLQTFADTWSEPVGQIEPFEGYATFNASSQPDVLFIDPGLASIDTLAVFRAAKLLGCPPPSIDPPQKAASRQHKTAARLEEQAAWSIRILAESGPARDVDTRAVVTATAAPGWDPLDRPEPPGLGAHVSVYFAHPEWKLNTTRYRLDARPAPADGTVWPLEVTTTVREPVRLTFEGLETVPASYEIWLVDDLAGVSIDLRLESTYTLAGSAAPRPLKLVVGRPAFAQAARGTSRDVPSAFALFPNFPNPFNPSTTLRYALPTPAPVSLVVYDVLGKQVAMLEAGAEKAAGYHAVVWDGRDAAGTPVASGLYFARMQAGPFAQTQKMLRVK